MASTLSPSIQAKVSEDRRWRTEPLRPVDLDTRPSLGKRASLGWLAPEGAPLAQTALNMVAPAAPAAVQMFGRDFGRRRYFGD
jgi:hypothetical protein